MSTVKQKPTADPQVKKAVKGAPVRKRSTTAKKSQSSATNGIESTKNSLSLLALTPFRFPLDVDKLALQSARIGGIAFVFFGILFSYHYLQSAMAGVVADVKHSAQLSAAVSCGSSCSNATLTPNVQFTYTAITDGYVIEFDVEEAQSIDVYAYEVQSGVYHKLGNATQIEESEWEYRWDTNEVNSGDYWVKALVTNKHGMYDRSDSQFVTVQ